MSDDSDDSAVLLNPSQILVYLLLPDRILPFARILCECLLFGLIPGEAEYSHETCSLIDSNSIERRLQPLPELRALDPASNWSEEPAIPLSSQQ